MATYRGTVKKNDLEGGFWELVCDDGAHYQLDADDADLFAEGKRVEIDGKVAKDAFGIGMASPMLRVARWKPGTK